MPFSFIDELKSTYEIKKEEILKRLEDFSKVPEENYFYEACFCILTPQSKAVNAAKVEHILKSKNFLENDLDLESILFEKNHYIRFHNTKAERLRELKAIFPDILYNLKSEISNFDKRAFILKNVKGYGLKESSHFMRNIGFRNLAILDRHILRNLIKIGIFSEMPKIVPEKNYYLVENEFMKFADEIKIPIDELDLLFFSQENGEILK